MTRFELAASSSRTKRATGLRYIPNRFALQKYIIFQYTAQNVIEFFSRLSKTDDAQMLQQNFQANENQDNAS